MSDLVKRFMNSDASMRLSVYREEYPENPRDMTDFPMCCEDFSRDYSIMNKEESERKSSTKCNLLRYLLQYYGKKKEITGYLKDAYTHKNDCGNALAYDRHRREWVVYSWIKECKDYSGNVHEAHWGEEWSFSTKFYDLDIYNIVDCLNDRTVMTLAGKFLDDGVKLFSYSFGYYGSISFSEFDENDEGVAYLVYDDCVGEGKWLTQEQWDTCDQLVEYESNADMRDFKAVKRIATASMKLFFPHWKNVADVDLKDFDTFCLQPAIYRRGIIKTQCHHIDPEFKTQMPNIHVKMLSV